jgi:hypothetical protein
MGEPRLGGLLLSFRDALGSQLLAQPGMLEVHVTFSCSCLLDAGDYSSGAICGGEGRRLFADSEPMAIDHPVLDAPV